MTSNEGGTLALDAPQVFLRRWLSGPQRWDFWQPIREPKVALYEYEKFCLKWEGPVEARLYVDGLEPLGCAQEFRWEAKGSLWLAGEYQMSLRGAEEELWTCRLKIDTRRSFTDVATCMLGDLEAWVQGVTLEKENGVWTHDLYAPALNTPLVESIQEVLRAIASVLRTPELEFGLCQGAAYATANSRDNRAVFKALQDLSRILQRQHEALALATPRSSSQVAAMAATIAARRREVNALLHHPLWEEISLPSASDHLTGKARHAKSYARVGKGLAEVRRHLQEQKSPNEAPLVQVRSSPIIFELWVLMMVIEIYQQEGFTVQQFPEWYQRTGRQRRAEVLSVSPSRFVMGKTAWTIVIDYDRALPQVGDLKTEEGLWMSGPHNRPDFLLQFRHGSQVFRQVVIDAKYRPPDQVWNTEHKARGSSIDQLQQYWSGLMCGYDTVHPSVLCVLPVMKEAMNRPSSYSDVTLLRTDPLHRDEVLQEDFARLLLAPLRAYQQEVACE